MEFIENEKTVKSNPKVFGLSNLSFKFELPRLVPICFRGMKLDNSLQ